ncbi:MAG: hypothetical protein WCP70_09790 [Methanothrix sp.]
MIILSGTIHGDIIPPTDTEKLYSAIANKIRESNTGAVLITDLPGEMYLNEKYNVAVFISSNVTSETPSVNLEYRKINVTGSTIRVLLSSENFKIEPLNPLTQIMSQGDYVRWDWQVTPLSIGNNSLDLIIYNYVVLEGSPQSVLNHVIRKPVYVKMKPLSDRNTMSSLGLFNTIVVILASFWLKSRKLQRGEIKRKF